MNLTSATPVRLRYDGSSGFYQRPLLDVNTCDMVVGHRLVFHHTLLFTTASSSSNTYLVEA